MFGIDVGLIAAALPYIRETCAFSSSQLASLVAAVLLGGIPGKIIAAQVSERFGRLAAFRLTAVLFVVAVPVICLSGGVFWAMFLGRLLQGVGCALAGLSGPLYMAECVDAKDRGKGTGMIQLVLTVGLVLAALVGWGVTQGFGAADSEAVSHAAKIHAWQTIFWFSVLPALVLFAGTFRLKESPRWLFKRGRTDDAYRSLRANNDEESARRIIGDLQRSVDAALVCDTTGRARAETLWQRKYVFPFVLAFLIMVLTQTTGINSILNYSVVLFQKAGLAGTSANAADTFVKLANFLMTAVALSLVDRRGRRFLLGVGTAGLVAGLSVVGCVFLGLENGWLGATEATGWAVVAGFAVFMAFYGLGPGVCVWLANSELMPLRIRANGMMITGFANMATSWLIARSFLPWSAVHGESSVFFSLAGLTVVYLLVVILLLPETKGRSLEEIEALFGGDSSKKHSSKLSKEIKT